MRLGLGFEPETGLETEAEAKFGLVGPPAVFKSLMLEDEDWELMEVVLPRAMLSPITLEERLEYTISTLSKSAESSFRSVAVASRQGAVKFSME